MTPVRPTDEMRTLFVHIKFLRGRPAFAYLHHHSHLLSFVKDDLFLNVKLISLAIGGSVRLTWVREAYSCFDEDWCTIHTETDVTFLFNSRFQ